MVVRRAHIWAALAASAAVIALSPATSGVTSMVKLRSERPVSLSNLGSITSFTPAIKDDRLAAAYARAALTGGNKSFRFTPTSGSMSGRRSVTVLVRAEGQQEDVVQQRALPTLSITPVAFNLGNNRGWRKFALPDSVGKRELDPVPVAIAAPAKGFALEQKKTRFSTNVLLDAERDVGTTPQTLAGEKTYSVNLASSYALTRNLDVTAGVRYRGPNNRLAPMTDERQDSQAVYLGTVFKF
jgi:hypothetical protein